MTAAEFTTRLIESYIAGEDEIRGCTEQEIKQIESENGVRLPEAYKRFLRAAGRGAGEFMDYLTVYFPKVLLLTKYVRSEMSENVTVPAGAFVFANHMGEQLFYFMCNGDDDPPVYAWDELRENLGVVYPSVWSFIEEELKRAEE